MANLWRIIIALCIAFTSLVLADDTVIPLVCHDDGVQIIAVVGTNVTNSTAGWQSYGLTITFVEKVMAALPKSDNISVNYQRAHTLNQTRYVFIPETIMGAGALKNVLFNYTQACPNTPIVLHGYSEGAVVVMNTLCGQSGYYYPLTAPLDSSYARNIISVITYGDESRTAGQSYNYPLSGGCQSNAPKLGRTAPQNCAAFEPAMRSYCFANDDDCCSTANTSVPWPYGIYWHYLYPAGFDNDAVDFTMQNWYAFQNSTANSTTTSSSSSTSTTSFSSSTTTSPFSNTTTTSATTSTNSPHATSSSSTGTSISNSTPSISTPATPSTTTNSSSGSTSTSTTTSTTTSDSTTTTTTSSSTSSSSTSSPTSSSSISSTPTATTSSSSSSAPQTTLTTMTTVSTSTSNPRTTMNCVADKCYTSFSIHPVTASSYCSAVLAGSPTNSPYPAACAGNYASRASSACACLGLLSSDSVVTVTSIGMVTLTSVNSLSTTASGSPVTTQPQDTSSTSMNTITTIRTTISPSTNKAGKTIPTLASTCTTDACLTSFSRHPMTMTSFCSALNAGVATASPFPSVCAGNYQSRVSSVCSCLGMMTSS